MDFRGSDRGLQLGVQRMTGFAIRFPFLHGEDQRPKSMLLLTATIVVHGAAILTASFGLSDESQSVGKP